MSDDAESLDAHAERLWLARAVGAPDNWRLRATNAAGLLSAAAAATVAGVALLDDLSGWMRTTAVVAAGAYAASVIAYLIASIWPHPDQGSKESRKFVDDVWRYCETETTPIRRMVYAGTLAAVVAIVATAWTLVLVATADVETRTAEVSVLETRTRRSLEAACPSIQGPFEATVENPNADHVILHISESMCGADRELQVPRADVLLLFEGN